MAETNPGYSLVAAYETERLKTLSVWSCFGDADLGFRPAPRSRTPLEHMVHQCVSEDTWMKNMLGIEVALPSLPAREDRLAFLRHYAEASGKRRERPRPERARGDRVRGVEAFPGVITYA